MKVKCYKCPKEIEEEDVCRKHWAGHVSVTREGKAKLICFCNVCKRRIFKTGSKIVKKAIPFKNRHLKRKQVENASR